MKKERRTKSRFWVYVLAYAIAIIMLLPMLWMLISAFKAPGSTVTVISKLLMPPYTLDRVL